MWAAIIRITTIDLNLHILTEMTVTRQSESGLNEFGVGWVRGRGETEFEIHIQRIPSIIVGFSTTIILPIHCHNRNHPIRCFVTSHPVEQCEQISYSVRTERKRGKIHENKWHISCDCRIWSRLTELHGRVGVAASDSSGLVCKSQIRFRLLWQTYFVAFCSSYRKMMAAYSKRARQLP